MEIVKNKTYRSIVQDLNSDGAGVAKINGYTFFVEGALPEEDITFKAVKVGKSFGYGKLLEIHKSSPHRVNLGEDSWVKEQIMPLGHLDYDKQLDYKKNQVEQAFKRIGKFDNFKVQDTLGMDYPFHYRNKAQVPVQEIDGRLETGVFRRRSHDLIPVEDTFITNKEIDQIVVEIRDILEKNKIKAYDESSGTGDIRHIIVKRGHHSEEVMVILVTNNKNLKNEDNIIKEILGLDHKIVSLIQNLQDKDTNVILGRKSKVLWGQDFYTDTMLDLVFKISEKSFYQVNTSQGERLYEKAIELGNLSKNDIVLDAYCGIGTITLNIAKYVKEVYGVEIVDQAIEMAKENAKINRIDNTRFITGDAEKIIIDLKKSGLNFDAVFVDPPRKGLDKKFINTLIEMEIPKIIYISCNPSSQARDCKVLKDEGYKLYYLQPVDMFPQTTHVETVVLITKKND